MFLRKSRSIEQLSAKAQRPDANDQAAAPKSPRRLKSKRSLRLFRSPQPDVEPMPSHDTSSPRIGDGDNSRARLFAQGQANAGLGIVQSGGGAFPSSASSNLGDTQFFSESRAPGLGMRLPPQHRNTSGEAPQTPVQTSFDAHAQSQSPSVDIASLQLNQTSPGIHSRMQASPQHQPGPRSPMQAEVAQNRYGGGQAAPQYRQYVPPQPTSPQQNQLTQTQYSQAPASQQAQYTQGASPQQAQYTQSPHQGQYTQPLSPQQAQMQYAARQAQYTQQAQDRLAQSQVSQAQQLQAQQAQQAQLMQAQQVQQSYAQSPQAYAQSPQAYAQSPQAYAQSPQAYAQSPQAQADVQAPQSQTYAQVPPSQAYAQSPPSQAYAQSPPSQAYAQAPSQYTQASQTYPQTYASAQAPQTSLDRSPSVQPSNTTQPTQAPKTQPTLVQQLQPMQPPTQLVQSLQAQSLDRPSAKDPHSSEAERMAIQENARAQQALQEYARMQQAAIDQERARDEPERPRASTPIAAKGDVSDAADVSQPSIVPASEDEMLNDARRGYPYGMDTSLRPSFASEANWPRTVDIDEKALLESERRAHAGVAMPPLHVTSLNSLGPEVGAPPVPARDLVTPTDERVRAADVSGGGAGASASALGAPANVSGDALGATEPPVSATLIVARSEGMLGPHILLYDDPCTASASPETAVAWTYDDWFLEAGTPATPGSDDNVTAVVGSSNTTQVAPDVCTHALPLAVFNSALRPVEGEECVYDMASKTARDAHELVPLHAADAATAVMPITVRARNHDLFPANRHVVLAATPRRLVAEMTTGSSPGLMEDVLLAYRTYFNAIRLQDLLFSRFEWAVRKLERAPVRATAVRVLRSTEHALGHWVKQYYDEDFADDELLVSRLVQFVNSQAQRSAHWPVSGTDAEVREGAVALWLLVQDRVPQEALNELDMHTPDVPALRSSRSSPSLRKVRSITKLFGREKRAEDSPTNSPALRSRKEGSGRGAHTRGPSNVSIASASTATGHQRTLSGSGSPHGHARRPSTQSQWESPRGKAESVFRMGRRSNLGLRRKLRLGESTEELVAPRDAEAESLERFSFRKYEPPAEPDMPSDALSDTASIDPDAALQRLEDMLEGRPAGSEVQRPRDGPIQWIPAHANASWKDAQRYSMLAADRGPRAAPAAAPTGWSEQGTLLLSQRSSTIARQLTTIEKQLFNLVHWSELTDLSWDHHTVQQEQWQREYQEYVTWRITAVGSSHEQLVPPVDKRGATHILIARFNRACAWVASHVVMTKEPTERVAMLSKWIRIAWDCYLLGNYATLCQILFGLQSPWVARLQASWRGVGAWEMRVFDALRRFTSPRDQFTQLRQAMLGALASHADGHIHVPFFGTFVSDLAANDALSLYIDSSLTPSMLPFYDDQELSQSWDTLVNLYRLRIKAMIVRDFGTLQEQSQRMQDAPMELPVLAEALQLDTLPAAQIQTPPRPCGYVARLTQETGGDMDRAMNRLLDGETPQPPALPAPADAPQGPPASPAYVNPDDEDAELQKAMAASIAPPPQRDTNMSEDEQLMRVLAESVQSETQRDAKFADEHKALDRLRTEGGPVALVPSVPVYTAVALVLEALYAIPSARDAFLGFPLPEHVTSVSSYWAGAHAARTPNETAIPVQAYPSVVLVQRVQTLFTVMQHTSRAALVLGDIVDVVPRDYMLQASRNAEMHVLLEVFLESLVHAYLEAMLIAVETIVCSSRTATVAARAEQADHDRSLFQSYATTALAAPEDGATPGEAQPTATITLVHSETDTFVRACLFSKLMASSEMDSLLITRPADVLLLNVQHQAEAALPPFRIEESISLDAFLWHTRRGGRIDNDPRWQQLQTWDDEKLALAQQRARLVAPMGKPVHELLTTCAKVRAAGDQYAELADWMGDVQHALHSEVQTLDVRLGELHDAMLTTRAALVRELDAAASETQEYAYTLYAVLLASRQGDCAYVRDGEQWYKLEQGRADRVSFDDLASDRRGLDEGRGVSHLAYARTGVPATPLRQAAMATVEAVAKDNTHATETRCT